MHFEQDKEYPELIDDYGTAMFASYYESGRKVLRVLLQDINGLFPYDPDAHPWWKRQLENQLFEEQKHVPHSEAVEILYGEPPGGDE